jgi:hypothetical protein
MKFFICFAFLIAVNSWAQTQPEVVHEFGSAPKHPEWIYVGHIFSEATTGLMQVDPNGKVSPYVSIGGQFLSEVFRANGQALRIYPNHSKSPEVRTAVDTGFTFQYQYAGSKQSFLRLTLWRFKPDDSDRGNNVFNTDASNLINDYDLSVIQFVWDHLNPQATGGEFFLFKATLGHRFVHARTKNTITIETEASPIGASWASYNIESIRSDQAVPEVIKRFYTPSSTGITFRVRPGVKVKLYLPKHLELNMRGGFFYQHSGGPNLYEQNVELGQFDKGELSEVGVQTQQRWAELHVELNRPIGPHRKIIGIYFDGQFWRKITAQNSFLNRRFDLTPLAPPVPFQVGVKARF